MGKHLNRAKTHFGTDTRGLLEGGRYALLHTRTLEFDELRPYVPGDEVRDIDWKASARSGTVLVKRFVTEKHHKVLLVADAGRNMSALAPSGEVKRDVAVAVMGAVGLITLGRSDEIGMVYGDSRGSANIRNRRGENHIEGLLDRFYRHTLTHPGASDIVAQLAYAATAHRRRMLIVVVSDEPDVNRRLDAVLKQLSGRHDVMWAMMSDMPAVASADGALDGYDVTTGEFVLGDAAVDRRVVAAYRRAEQARVKQLDAVLTARAIPYTRIAGSSEIRARLVDMTEMFSRAG
ncbi:MAG: DUF58 domain-containing protein [Mycobacteriaceae bacterium]|nr:DUF58 domain-containing protein [Mycobacteriaceae bacterium]MBV9638405.1 DUF58 domain-containing protein [Mycobacteriaceae bacterium]